jgi:hypothetical protein
LLVLLPFIKFNTQEEVLIGVDVAASESDTTKIAIFDNQSNLIDTIDKPLSECGYEFNCKSAFVEEFRYTFVEEFRESEWGL